MESKQFFSDVNHYYFEKLATISYQHYNLCCCSIVQNKT